MCWNHWLLCVICLHSLVVLCWCHNGSLDTGSTCGPLSGYVFWTSATTSHSSQKTYIELFHDVWQLRQRGTKWWVSGNALTNRIQHVASVLQMDWSHSPFCGSTFSFAGAAKWLVAAWAAQYGEIASLEEKRLWQPTPKEKNTLCGAALSMVVSMVSIFMLQRHFSQPKTLGSGTCGSSSWRCESWSLLGVACDWPPFTWRRRWRKEQVSSPTCRFCDQAVLGGSSQLVSG